MALIEMSDRMVRLHAVDDRPEWRVGCGWGLTYRASGPAWVKILLPKREIPCLRRAIAQATDVDRLPVVTVRRWQWRVVMLAGEDATNQLKGGN